MQCRAYGCDPPGYAVVANFVPGGGRRIRQDFDTRTTAGLWRGRELRGRRNGEGEEYEEARAPRNSERVDKRNGAVVGSAPLKRSARFFANSVFS